MSRVHTARRKAGKAQKAAGHAGRNARKRASKTAGRVAPVLEQARGSASEYASEAADWVQPRFETARDKVKGDVVPAISGAVTTALVASEPVREEALTRGTAALAALRGEVAPPKRKKRWGRRLLFLVALAGAAAGGFAAWSKKAGGEFPSTIGDEESVLAGAQPDSTEANPSVVGQEGEANGADPTGDEVDIRSGRGVSKP